MAGFTGIYRYRINGAIDTSKTVMDNMESIANSAGAWVTYDIMEGKWAVVINKPRDPDAYFNDDNIIGSINVSGTGLSDLYNSVEVQFPHRDLNDQSDFINIEIPDEDRNPNEPDNTLTLSYDQVNEPIQAQLLGLIELKQSRIDLVIQFTTDFSQINIEAGHVIAVTNSIYGWTDKLFRVVSLTEVENESGINIEITALEYDANVYDTTDLYRYLRTNADGIITIGALGQPGQPQVTKFEESSRPRFIVESLVPDNTDPLNPAGVVEGLEFWIYSIPGGELPTWELVDDTTRTYTLYKTVRSTSGGVIEPGTNITLDMDNFDPGNFLVKTRAINSTTAGPFSELSGLVEYVPAQVTDIIGANTQAIDPSKDGGLGNNLLGTLSAAALLQLVKKLLEDKDGPNVSGSISQTVFDTVKTYTNSDMVQQAIDKPYIKTNAKYCVITYTFTDGQDLDTKTNIFSPDVGQNYEGTSSPSFVKGTFLGYGGEYQTGDGWPSTTVTTTDYLRFAGDNTGTGTECVVLDLDKFKTAYPSASEVKIRCGAQWYSSSIVSTSGTGSTATITYSTTSAQAMAVGSTIVISGNGIFNGTFIVTSSTTPSGGQATVSFASSLTGNSATGRIANTGILPVKLQVVLYEGGTLNTTPSGFTWTVTGATKTTTVLSQDVVVTDTSAISSSTSWGTFMGSFGVNLRTNTAEFSYGTGLPRRTSNSGLYPVYFDKATNEYVYYQS